MKLLLDTHIWLWIHREPWKLTSEVNQILADPDTDLWLSPVSIWELITLLDKRRVSIREDVNQWIEKSQRELLLREAPFSWEVARSCGLRCCAILRTGFWPRRRRRSI